MIWLKSVFALMSPRLWLALAIVAAVAGFTGFVYHAGWSSANKDHLAYIAREANIRAGLVLVQKSKEVESAKLVADLTKRRAEDRSAINLAWIRWVSNNPGGDSGTKPVPVRATVCSEPAANDRLSDALQKYLDGVRAATARAKAESAGLLEQCQLEVNDYLLSTEWVRREREINRSE